MRTRTVQSVAVVGIGVMGAATAIRRAERRAAASFYDSAKLVLPSPGSSLVTTFPAVIHRAEAFAGLVPADLEAVTSVLPSAAIHPVRLPDGRALVIVQATRFHEITDQHVDGPTLVARPYAEVAVGVLVTRRPAPPLVPLLSFAPASMAAGVFPLQMPVTSREARDPGRAMGLPKFMADLDFEDDVTTRRVRVSEDGLDILELTIDVDGPMTPRAQKQSWFHVFDGELHETTARTYGYTGFRVGGRLGRLTLGTHPVDNDLRHLRIAEAAVATIVTPAMRALMPAPRRIGPATARRGYPGRDIELGRYTVRHPHTDAVDQYAPVGLEESARFEGARVPVRVEVG